jgi:hypothetical protein
LPKVIGRLAFRAGQVVRRKQLDENAASHFNPGQTRCPIRAGIRPRQFRHGQQTGAPPGRNRERENPVVRLAAPFQQERPMSIFSSILDKIFHHPQARNATRPAPAAPAPQAAAPAPQAKPAQPATLQPGAQPAAPAAAPQAPVDVEAVLSAIAAQKPGPGNWRSSIVDLLKLLDLDSSLEARKQLAQELHVDAGPAGSAEENIALHKAVMRKLAENGGKVPADLGA